jgi:hypothetical protein
LNSNRCTATVAPVDHAVVMVLDQAGVFGQAFFLKGCDHACVTIQKEIRVN